MLNRREFIRLSAVLAAGSLMPAIPFADTHGASGQNIHKAARRPVMHLRGHKKSGCAFHPELTDIWEGGGAQLPADI